VRRKKTFKFNLTKPCHECPFRSDKVFYLRPLRRAQIWEDISENDKTFTCHLTLEARERSHCAGALITLEKAGKTLNNFLLRLAMEAGMYDPAKMDLDAPVSTEDEFLRGRGDSDLDTPS
jgi:hypothetical protein